MTMLKRSSWWLPVCLPNCRMPAIESLGVVRQGVLRRKTEPLQRRDCSPAPWSGKKTEPISLPKSFFVFLQQGRQQQLNLRKRSEIMVAHGVRRDRQLFRFERSKYALRVPISKEFHQLRVHLICVCPGYAVRAVLYHQ